MHAFSSATCLSNSISSALAFSFSQYRELICFSIRKQVLLHLELMALKHIPQHLSGSTESKTIQYFKSMQTRMLSAPLWSKHQLLLPGSSTTGRTKPEQDLYATNTAVSKKRFPLPACQWLLLYWFGLMYMLGLQNPCQIKCTRESSICQREKKFSVLSKG